MSETKFWNPYAFVPFESRAGADGFAGHERLRSDEIAGTIDLRFEVATPLLCLDESTRMMGRDGHPSFRVVRDPRDPVDPWIPPASFKGSLRSAYEAITGSRVPFFDRTDRLGFRRAINDAASAVPAVVDDAGESRSLRLLFGALTPDSFTSNGSSKIEVEFEVGGRNMTATVPLLPAAFIGTATLRSLAGDGRSVDELAGLEAVASQMELFVHKVGRDRFNFAGYVVTEIRLLDSDRKVSRNQKDKALPSENWIRVAKVAKGVGDRPIDTVISDEVAGRLLITGARSARNKHEERFAFALDEPNTVEIAGEDADRLFDTWRMVMESYLEAHDLGPKGRPSGTGPMSNVEWARHLRVPASRDLGDGSTVWCGLDDRGSPVVLTPVSSSRDLFETAPVDMLNASHRPAMTVDELSPADRMFGWVAEKGSVENRGRRAVRGRVSIIDLYHECDDRESDRRCRHIKLGGITLDELASPKPQYGRFYLRSADGSSISTERKRWFSTRTKNGAPAQELAGRKFYWFHEPVSAGSEERKPTKRNRTAKDSVSPEAKFVVRLRVDGARIDDFRALLDLLEVLLANGNGERSHLQVGYGKPLGYGALRLSSVETSLRTGAEWESGLRSLRMGAGTNRDLGATLTWLKGFDPTRRTSTVAAALAAWSRITAGPEELHGGVHYPQSSPQDNGYEWFMENERKSGGQAPGRGIVARGVPVPLGPFAASSGGGRRNDGGGQRRSGGGGPRGPRGGGGHGARRPRL